MNKMSQSATPYDLNVLSNVSVDGDRDIAAYLAAHDITISNYAKVTEQISVYEADMTYSELFEGQKVKFWPIDEKVPDSKVSVISISDLNRALAMQNKAPITLNDGQYLLNCNYNGTYRYVAAALQSHPEITVGGATLQRAEDNVLQETYVMTSVGNNDRGTLIVPDSVTASLEKDVNALLVQYEPNADSNEILQKMIPIGLDSTHGYRYAEKNMMYETFYGLDALVSFLCCYIQLSLMGCAGYVVIGDTLINPCTAYDKKGLLPAGDPERIWFTPLFSDGIWYGRRLAAQMDLLISGSSRKSPENVNSFTEKPEKVADSPAKDTKMPCSFTEPAKAAAPVSTPVSTKKVETWKPAELNETKNGQLTFF